MEKNQNIKICQNGLVSLESREFKVDKELKEEFLSDKHPNTAQQIKITLLKAESSEAELQKSVYDFTLEDIENMIFTNFAYKSEKALSSKISHLRKYVDFCIKKNYAKTNNFKLIYDLKKYENTVANKHRYITSEDLIKYENILINPIDKLLLELLFLGLSQDEICSLKKSDISFRDKTITIANNENNKKIIKDIPDRLIQIASDSETAEKYYTNNGNDDTARSSKIYAISKSPYVLPPAVTTASKENLDKIENYTKPKISYIQRKITAFRTWLDNPYLTTNSIRMSGIADYTLRYMEQKGGEDKMSNHDYAEIYKKFYNDTIKNVSSINSFKKDITRIIELLKEQE